MYDISRSGLESWFQDNIPFALEEYGLDTGALTILFLV